MKKILIFLLFTCLISQTLWAQPEAQVNTNKNKGKLYKFGVGAIQSGDYFLAKAYFDALKDKGFENNEQIYHYAKLLNSLGDFENSNKYIDSLLAKKYDNPLLIYQKTLVSMKLQKEKDALDYASFFLKNKENKTNFPSETRHLSELKRYLDSLSFRVDSIEYSVYNLSDAINGPAAEFSPIITNDGLLYGKQELDKVKYFNAYQLSKGKVSPTRKLYLAKGRGLNLQKSELFDIQIPDREISSICFDVSQRNAYLTACKFDEKTEKYICNIFHVKKIRNDKKEWLWNTPVMVPELFEENVSVTHVSFAFDPFKNMPVIYFSSNKEGGRGGMDIWYSYLNLKTNKFGKIVNAGGRINTSRDDITPNYHSQSKTLFFSSNGRGGYGGFDIYGSYHKEGAFQEVKQLGQEVNSPQDDIFYYPNRDLSNGYLVSNRYSSHSLINPHCCDDIFYFDKNATSKNNTKLNLKATNENGDPITEFEYKISQIDSLGNKTPIIYNLAKDSVLISSLGKNSEYEIEVNSPNFKSKTIKKKTLNDNFHNLEIKLDSILFPPLNSTNDTATYFDKSTPQKINPKNRANLLLKATNENGDKITEFEYKIWEIDTLGKKTALVYQKTNDSAIFPNLKKNSKYEIEITNKFFEPKTFPLTTNDKNQYEIIAKLDSLNEKNNKNPYYNYSSNNSNTSKIKLNITNNQGFKIPEFEYTIWEIDANGIRIPLESKSARDTAVIEDLKQNTQYEIEVFNNKFYRKKIIKQTLKDSLYYINITLDSIDFRPILLPLIEFDFDSFVINNESRHIVDSLVYPVLLANPTLVIELSAHTDSRGTDEYNEILSEKRAQSMKAFLENYREINPKRLKAKGYGEYVPIAPNENPDGTDNPEGRQRNRRCEFRILEEEFYD